MNVRIWGLIWVLVAASLMGSRKTWGRDLRFILALMVLQLAVYLAVYAITPNDPAGQIRDSFPRLLLHVLPLGVALISFKIHSFSPDRGSGRAVE